MRRIYLAIPALLFATSGAAQDLPDGPGKDATLQLCNNCHQADTILGYRQGRDEWTGTIQKMISLGAEGTPEQFTAVLEYLVKNFGPALPPINVNKATATELASGLSITAKEAEAIVRYRTDKGAFKAIDDLKKVPELDFKKIEAQRERLLF